MKILVYGPKARYDAYMPDFAAQLGAELVFCPLDQSPRQAAAENPDAQVLFDDPIVDVGREIIDLLPNLKLIQSEGVAFNRIDLEAAKEKGIFVCNNKGCNADSVAEHTIMLMLMALRHGITGHNAVKAGRQVQMKEAVMASGSPELGEQTVGLVGFGDIAQATARRLKPFGCKMYYYSLHRRSPEVEADFGVEYLPLEELAAACDILSLHCAVNDQTRNMVNADLVAKMKPGITGHNAVKAGRQVQMKEAVMASGSPELGEQTVGLVGFGDIAQATARRLKPFGCKMYYYSLHRRSPKVEADFGVEYLPLDELAAACDILSLHCAVNDQTRNMVNADLVAKMKPGIILVNTARGDLVDNLAVRQGLLDGRIGGIAMDTLAPEPTPADHSLVDLPAEISDRAIYSPHLGGNTGGSFRRAHSNMWNNVKLIQEGKRPNFVVNGL